MSERINFIKVYVKCSSLTLQFSPLIVVVQVDALVAAVAQLQANVREIQRTTTTANTAADEFDAVIILQTHDT